MTEEDRDGFDDHPIQPSRREAILMLTGVCVAAGAYGMNSTRAKDGRSEASADVPTPERVATAAAVAEVVYPTAANVDESFIERRLFGRAGTSDEHFEHLVEALETVEKRARALYGGSMSSLSSANRRRVLDDIGVYSVHPRPDGTSAERVRFYLVNDLVYALFTHPKGGGLLGVPNPPGHPGGNELYQRGPQR